MQQLIVPKVINLRWWMYNISL